MLADCLAHAMHPPLLMKHPKDDACAVKYDEDIDSIELCEHCHRSLDLGGNLKAQQAAWLYDPEEGTYGMRCQCCKHVAVSLRVLGFLV